MSVITAKYSVTKVNVKYQWLDMSVTMVIGKCNNDNLLHFYYTGCNSDERWDNNGKRRLTLAIGESNSSKRRI